VDFEAAKYSKVLRPLSNGHVDGEHVHVGVSDEPVAAAWAKVFKVNPEKKTQINTSESIAIYVFCVVRE
jgi:hypothetical protein